MNSSIEITEANKLAQKLIDRTAEGRLNWEAADTGDVTELGSSRFTTVLEGNLRASISEEGAGQRLDFSLVEFDPSSGGSKTSSFIPYDKSPTPPGNRLGEIKGESSPRPVLGVSIERDPSYGFDTPDERQLARLLVDLYGLARRSALKVAGSVERALTYLDKIAS